MVVNFQYNQKNTVLSYAVAELISHIMLLSLPVSFISNNNYVDGHGCDCTISLDVMSDLSGYGLPPVADPKIDDQYFYKLSPSGGVIAATNSRSVLLCVYALLRKLGFRFLRPSKSGTIIPKNVNIDMLFTEFSASATTRHRGVCIEGANSVENIVDFIEWLPKLGYNSFFMQFRSVKIFVKRWTEHLFNPLIPDEKIGEDFYNDADQKTTAAIAKCGLLHHRVGHGWIGLAVGNETIGWDENNAPADETIKPLLAMVNGKREFFGGIPTDTSLCYTNPEAVRRLTQCVADYAQENQYVDYLHFWLADSFNNVCECEECMKSSITDQYVKILNSIDEELTRRNLDTKIVFLLYHELLYPPITEKIKNENRFVMMFAPISRTFEKSYLTDHHDLELPEFVRNKMVQPVSIDENLAFLKAWQKVFHGDSFVYDYPLGRAHYGDFGYSKISSVLFEDIHALNDIGLNGYISCQQLRTFSPSALPNYTMGLSLFDSSLSFEEIDNEYSQAAYGSDWSKAKEYLRLVSSISDTDYVNGKTQRISKDVSEKYKNLVEIFMNFRPVISANIMLCPAEHRIFWDVLDFSSNYCIILSNAICALAAGDTENADKYYNSFLAYIRKNEVRYQSSLDVFRIQEVTWHYTKFNFDCT